MYFYVTVNNEGASHKVIHSLFVECACEIKKETKRNSAGKRNPTGKLSPQCCLQQHPAIANPSASSATRSVFQQILAFAGVLICHFLQWDPVRPLLLSCSSREAPKEDF